MLIGPVCTPYSAARHARYATRPLATIVFVGVHPSLMQVPPTCFRSIRAVCIPAAASAVERGVPACPEPMMMASYCCAVVIGTLAIRMCVILPENFRIWKPAAVQAQWQPGLPEWQSQHPEGEGPEAA